MRRRSQRGKQKRGIHSNVLLGPRPHPPPSFLSALRTSTWNKAAQDREQTRVNDAIRGVRKRVNKAHASGSQVESQQPYLSQPSLCGADDIQRPDVRAEERHPRQTAGGARRMAANWRDLESFFWGCGNELSSDRKRRTGAGALRTANITTT